MVVFVTQVQLTCRTFVTVFVLVGAVVVVGWVETPEKTVAGGGVETVVTVTST